MALRWDGGGRGGREDGDGASEEEDGGGGFGGVGGSLFIVGFFLVFFVLFFSPLQTPRATGQPNAPITQSTCLRSTVDGGGGVEGLLGTWLGMAVWWVGWQWTDEVVGRRRK